jgi:hypothetical protein
VSDELLPTGTLPKFSVEGATAKDPVVGGGGGWVLDPAETPAQPARTIIQTSATRVQSRRDRELFVLSINTIMGPEPGRVERAKSHDRWRELNCTLVTQLAIIEVAAGILKLPAQGCNWLVVEFLKRSYERTSTELTVTGRSLSSTRS